MRTILAVGNEYMGRCVEQTIVLDSSADSSKARLETKRL